MNRDLVFLSLVIFILLLFLFTSVIDIKLGHILAVAGVCGVMYFLNTRETTEDEVFIKDISSKLSEIKEIEDVRYFHIDANLLILFYEMKGILAEYNPISYKNALKTADNLLKLREDVEKTNTNNTYDNYTVAESQVKKCLNYTQGFVISLPDDPVLRDQYKKIMSRLHLLLKRNLDIIKKIYEKNSVLTSNHKFITDYDLPKPADKTQKFGEERFNFYVSS